jgi:hypothetical protein
MQPMQPVTETKVVSQSPDSSDKKEEENPGSSGQSEQPQQSGVKEQLCAYFNTPRGCVCNALQFYNETNDFFTPPCACLWQDV